jgi:tetratricopeptide (TPR) repeat protein
LIGLAITDALIDRLGRFEPFVVRPTAAVRTYADSADDPAAVGRALRTDAVVDSSFERLADRVHLSARLLRSGDGAKVWSGEFDEAGGAAAAAAIADAVASHFGAALPDPSRALVRRSAERERQHAGTATPSASRLDVYELCGRGRAHLLSASMFEVPQAVEAFRSAIELDGSYAPAHAGLALAYCAQAVMRTGPLVESYRDARAAALRALAMDDESADAQVALGTVLFFGEWGWRAAERSLQRALEMNPSHVQAYMIFGRLLDALGRQQEALDMKLRAFEHDPFSPLVHVQIALSYWNQRQYDLAIDWANRALEIDPRHLLAREFLAGAYRKKGYFDRYMTETIAHAESYGVSAEALETLKEAYASGGRAGVARYGLGQLGGNPNAPAFQLALLSAEIGDGDAAFLHLDRAIQSRDPSLVDLAVAPQWDCLRADPRFEERLATMGLRTPTSSSRNRDRSKPLAVLVQRHAEKIRDSP